MLPKVTLKEVTRGDVDRIAWWLQDRELSHRWFGHYACGDPVHRGYDPEHMLEAGEREWGQIFGDPRRVIWSIYSEIDEHIGECQIVMDGEGGGELALLIGRKDHWHRGYGTATVIRLLDYAFEDHGLDKVWVSVAEDNMAAAGLFEKIGFSREETRQLCKGADGSALHVGILVADIRSYRTSQFAANSGSVPVLTISGLPGSGSGIIGAEVARMVESSFVGDEILDMLCQRLGCSRGELEALQSSRRSFWRRLLNLAAAPVEWKAVSDVENYLSWPESSEDGFAMDRRVTKTKYVDALADVIRELSMDGGVVIHGHNGRLLVPSSVESLNVFVAASREFRQHKVSVERNLDSREAQEWLEREDRGVMADSENLFDTDLLDMGNYDLTINLDRMTPERATQVIAGLLSRSIPSGKLDGTRPAAPRSVLSL